VGTPAALRRSRITRGDFRLVHRLFETAHEDQRHGRGHHETIEPARGTLVIGTT